jgi:hypothetical protein
LYIASLDCFIQMQWIIWIPYYLLFLIHVNKLYHSFPVYSVLTTLSQDDDDEREQETRADGDVRDAVTRHCGVRDAVTRHCGVRDAVT